MFQCINVPLKNNMPIAGQAPQTFPCYLLLHSSNVMRIGLFVLAATSYLFLHIAVSGPLAYVHD